MASGVSRRRNLALSYVPVIMNAVRVRLFVALTVVVVALAAAG